MSLVTDAGATETRNVIVGLMVGGPIPSTRRSGGTLYEVISGLAEGDSVVRQNGQDSRFRNQGPTESAGPNAKHARGLQLTLAFYTHLGKQQVARIAGEIILSQFG